MKANVKENTIFYSENIALPVISTTDIAIFKAPYVHFRRRYHEYIMYYILEGELFLTEGDINYHLKENDFIILEPTKEHSGWKSSVCSFCYVHFSWEQLYMWAGDEERTENNEANENDETNENYDNNVIKKEKIIEKKNITEKKNEILTLPKYYHVEGIRNVLRCREIIEKIVKCFHSREVFADLRTANLFYELLLVAGTDYAQSIYKEKAPFQGKARLIIPELMEYMNQSYSEDITGDFIEEKFHYNFDYLNRQFKKWTGETIFAYLNRVRMERARQLLQTGFYKVEEVALQTGFQNVYYFERVFKKFYGVTPGKVRQVV